MCAMERSQWRDSGEWPKNRPALFLIAQGFPSGAAQHAISGLESI
jgi:hypothetical protein